jgi:hypothetical protein
MVPANTGHCVGTDLELWFGPADGTSRALRETPAEQAFRQRTAKAICAGCPLVSSCLEEELAHSVGDQWGVRGGMTAKERKDLIRIRRTETEAA